MNRTKIAQLYADAESLGGQTVTVAGWVKSVRDMKNFGFVTLNDGSCFRDLQVVMNREALDNYDEIAHQNVSAALICTGTVKLTPDAPQPFELSATSIEVEGTSAPDYPLQKKPAHPAAPAPAHQPVPRRVPHPLCRGCRHPPLLPGAGLCLRQHPHHHHE